MIALAKQTGARAVMTPAGLSSYSHPTIDGVEWYPNNVRFSGASNAGTLVCLNISYQDARYLTALCAEKAAAGGSAQMKLYAVGGTEAYSVAPDTTTMLRTLIAEIRGTTKADERVIFMGHVQEPGAEDNASGVAQQLEMVRAYQEAHRRWAAREAAPHADVHVGRRDHHGGPVQDLASGGIQQDRRRHVERHGGRRPGHHRRRLRHRQDARPFRPVQVPDRRAGGHHAAYPDAVPARAGHAHAVGAAVPDLLSLPRALPQRPLLRGRQARRHGVAGLRHAVPSQGQSLGGRQ